MRMSVEAKMRDATLEDAEAIAHVHLASSADAYAPLAKAWRAPDLESRVEHWRRWLEGEEDPGRVVVLVEAEGRVVALASGGGARHRKGIDAEVELRVIHVLPELRGQGFGGRLWAEVTGRLRTEALRSLYVATLAELRCTAFYEARGGVVALREPKLFHGSSVMEVLYLWPEGRSSELQRGGAAR